VQNGVAITLSSLQNRSEAAASAIHRLAQVRSIIEDRFLAAGETIGLAVSGVAGLIGALDQMAGALNPDTVEATRTELSSSAQSLFGLQERLETRRAKSRDLGLLVDSLLGAIEDMRRDLAYLRVFSINIKITAAGIPGAGEDFALFAQEISDRIESGRVELERFALEVAALHGQLDAALAQERALASECERRIPAVPNGLAASAHDVAAHHEKVARVAVEVRELAADIQRKVGAALAALQVGDMTRQRVEHVQQGLKLLPATCPDEQDRARLSAAVIPLLASQLDAAAADFHRDAAQVQHSMAAIADHASEILRLKDLAFGASAADEGFLDRVTIYLDQALNLVGQMEDADAAAVMTGRAAVGAVAALNRRIAALQSIKTDVQQMALNTTLKCAQIGDSGKPLSVIAIELRGHAGLLEASAERSLVVLDELATQAARMAEDQPAASAGSALTTATARLRSANATVEADIVAVAKLGETVVQAIGETARQLDFQGEIGAMLDAAASALNHAVQALGETMPVDEALLAPVLQTIAKSYTMSQEREVHAALTAGLALQAPAEPPQAAAVDELEAVLF
jgi:hypothetical protein